MWIVLTALMLGVAAGRQESAVVVLAGGGLLVVLLGRAWHEYRFPGLMLRLLLGGAAGAGAVWLDGAMQPEVVLPAGPQTLQGVLRDAEWALGATRLELATSLGVVQLTLRDGAGVPPLPGDRVQVTAQLRDLPGRAVPGGFDHGAWLRGQGIVALGSVRGGVTLLSTGGDFHWNRLREKVSRWLAQRLPASQSALAAAMLVGRQGGMDLELRDRFSASGLYHLLAISGLQMGLVAGWVFALTRGLLALVIPLSRHVDVRPLAAWCALPAVLAYASLAGWGVSIQRAALMTGLFLLAVALGRENQLPRALGLAAGVLLLWHPGQWGDAGFWLSFGAVTTIAVVLQHPPAWPAPPALPGRRQRWRGRVRGMVHGVMVSSFLGLTLAPITASLFHFAHPWGLPLNLLAIPWTGMVTVPAGLLTLLLLPLSLSWAGEVAALVGWSLEVLDRVAAWSLTQPGGWVRLAGPSWGGVMMFQCAALAGVVLWRGGRARLLALGLAALGLLWPRPHPPDDALLLAVLDVGQGQAVALHLPGDGWSLLDAGGGRDATVQCGRRGDFGVAVAYGRPAGAPHGHQSSPDRSYGRSHPGAGQLSCGRTVVAPNPQGPTRR
ncbi:MAG: ComEC family competence protein [Magnetococcus sp. WYHC-3]